MIGTIAAMAGEPVAGTPAATRAGDVDGGFAAALDTLLAPEAGAPPVQAPAPKADVNPLLLAVTPEEAPVEAAADAPAAPPEAAPVPAARGTQPPLVTLAVKQAPTGEAAPEPDAGAELPAPVEGRGGTAASPKKATARLPAEPEPAETAAPRASEQPVPVGAQVAQLQAAAPAKGAENPEPQASAGTENAPGRASRVGQAPEAGAGARSHSPVHGADAPPPAPADRPFEPAVAGDGTMMAAADAPRHAAMPSSQPLAASTATPPMAHSHEAVTVPAQPGRVGHDIGVEIARRAAAGGDELLIRLDPAEMGRIEVRMSFDDGGGLKAVLAADSPAALDLLRRESADLQRALSDAGIRADPQNLRFDSRGSGDGQPGQRQHPAMQRQQDAAGTYANDDFEQIDYRPVRPNGRVDLMA